jgi:prepilin peptidase CpaA
MTVYLTQLILMTAVPTMLAYACFSDLFSMRISNRLCFAVLAAFIVFSILTAMPPMAVLWHVLAGLLVLAVSFTLFAFGWIGGGDAKFVAAAAVWLGFGQLWEYFAISSLLGGALTLAILFLRSHPLPQSLASVGWIGKLHDKGTGVPYGIALGIAAIMLLPHGTIWQATF